MTDSVGGYTTARIEQVFSQEQILHQWTQIEQQVLEAQAGAGLIPAEWAQQARAVAVPEVAAWRVATARTRHEVAGFLLVLGLDHVHIGLTSSDLTDTALAMRVWEANEEILHQGMTVMRATKRLQLPVRRLARTHGQPAVPSTLQERFRVLTRQTGRCLLQIPDIPGKISGPVGTHLTPLTSPELEREVLARLRLDSTTCSQIVPRDYLSRWAWAVADLCSSYEAWGVEIRLLAHHQVGEAHEGTSSDYVGSSAMPHKRNPNQSERLCGLGRLARHAAAAISEGIPQWHDRDLAHSSVERVQVPALAGYAAYGGMLLGQVLRSLVIDVDRMAQNLEAVEDLAGTHLRMVQLQLGGASYWDAAQAAVGARNE